MGTVKLGFLDTHYMYIASMFLAILTQVISKRIHISQKTQIRYKNI